MMKSILLVEDDVEIIELLRLHFNTFYELTACTFGIEAIEKTYSEIFDLIILDIMLPDLDGIEICKKIRETNSNCPIMMLTSRSEEIDKVLALEFGADDYVTKPFGIRELMARTKALLRRSDQNHTQTLSPKTTIHFKDIFIDMNKMKACLKGKRLDLTHKELDLLILLASNPGKTFSRLELLKLVWGYSFSGYEHTVTAHINRLRIKIENNLNYPEYILTTWGMGYRFSE